MDLGGSLGHLTYSTLVHPGDNWDEMWHSLTTYVPAVKKRVCPDRPFGVSLRLSGKSAERLTADAGERTRLKAFLADNDMYLYTVNAFPHGAFKGERVKEQVYEPDWRSDARALYTMQVADILAEVAPGPEVVDAYTRQLLRVVAHLARLEERSGRTVTLALEPEPFCFMEVTAEAVDYFTHHLYAEKSAEALAKLTGLPVARAHAALRRHLGVVYDICHQAVEFEDITASLASLVHAGIPIFKLQEAAALRVLEVTQELVDALRPFADTVYLTQTIEKRDGRLTRYLNLEDAFAAWEKDPGPREWRTHFHVPVFLDDLGLFKTTRFAIEDALRFHKATPLSRQLEIETYTWDVLPAHLKTGDIIEYVVRELEWVQGQLS